MAFPSIQKFTSGGMLLNQRITFVSLLATQGEYITGITNQAIAQGYTCAGSSNGVVGAMDGVNRCTTAAGFAVRAANTTTAQSWIVIAAANGAKTLFAFTGGSDDVARISFSPGGLFVAAGTPTFAPTATDECVIGTNSTIGNTASADRLFCVWIDSAHNGWRSAIFRASAMVAPMMGVELYDPAFVTSPVTVPVPSWGHLHTPAGATLLASVAGTYALNTNGGIARFSISSVATNVVLGGSCKAFNFTPTIFLNQSLVMNGSVMANQPIGLYSEQVGAKGDIGNRYDWHFCNEAKACGELTSAKDWILLSNNPSPGSQGGTLWPWDGVSNWVGA